MFWQPQTPKYHRVVGALVAAGLDIQKPEEVSSFANRTFTTPTDVASFEARAIIQQEYGANHHYTGNGTTKNLLPGDEQRGVMEVLNVDKNPELIGQLIEGKAAMRVLLSIHYSVTRHPLVHRCDRKKNSLSHQMKAGFPLINLATRK